MRISTGPHFSHAAGGDSIFHSRRKTGFQPDAADKLYRLAEICRDAGRTDRMLELLKAYLRAAPGRPEMAAALALTGGYREALKKTAEFFSSGGLSPEETFLLGNPWLNIHDSKFIKKALRKVFAEKAAGSAAKIKALHIFILRGRLGEPAGRPPLFTGRLSIINTHCAQPLLETGHPCEAAKLLQETLKYFPRDEYCCGKLSEALLCSGRRKEALALMGRKEKILRSPGFSAWHGQLLLLCRKYGEAAEKLEKTPAAASPMSLCWLGAALLKLKGPAAAEKLLRRAAGNHRDLEAAAWLAEALRLSGKNREALKTSERALAADPAHPWALLNAALLNWESGNRTGAGRLFGKFSRGAGRFLEPPPKFTPAWALAALERAGGCRRHERHFISLAANDRRA